MSGIVSTGNSPEGIIGGIKLHGLTWAASRGLPVPPTHVYTGAPEDLPLNWAPELIIRPSLNCRWEQSWRESGRFSSKVSNAGDIAGDIVHVTDSILAEIVPGETVSLLVQPYYQSAIAGIAHVFDTGLDIVWDMGPNADIAAGLVSGHRLTWDATTDTYACPTLDWPFTSAHCKFLGMVTHQLRRVTASASIEVEWLVDGAGSFFCLQAQPAAPGSHRVM